MCGVSTFHHQNSNCHYWKCSFYTETYMILRAQNMILFTEALAEAFFSLLIKLKECKRSYQVYKGRSSEGGLTTCSGEKHAMKQEAAPEYQEEAQPINAAGKTDENAARRC